MTPRPDVLPLTPEEASVAERLALALPALVGAWDEGQTDNVQLAETIVRLVSRTLDAARQTPSADLTAIHVTPMQMLRDDEDPYVIWNAAVEATKKALLAASQDPEPRDLGGEYGRLLAERDRLIASGVDPADLACPDALATDDPKVTG